MPELPEVEVVRQGLGPLISGRKIEKCRFSKKSLRLPLQHSLFKSFVMGATVCRVSRRAKYIIIKLDNRAKLVVHLGMTGKLGIFPQNNKYLQHDHVCLSLDNSMELRFNDVRRFGSMQVVSPGETLNKLFEKIGPEPLGQGLTVEYLHLKSKKRSQPVKNFLMDSHIVAGIGNIYANEILFEAGIRPDKPVNKLSASQWRKVILKTRSVLRRAIRAGGSTIADFVGSSGDKGYFQLQLNVYGKKGQECPNCRKEILRSVMAGRATYFCRHCQQ